MKARGPGWIYSGLIKVEELALLLLICVVKASESIQIAAKRSRQTASLAISAGFGYSLSSTRWFNNVMPRIACDILCHACEIQEYVR